MSSRTEFEVPGKFLAGSAFVDIETKKVPTPDGFVMPSGEPMRRRWSAFLVGIARDGLLIILDAEGDEPALICDADWELASCDRLVYGATREFDEMVLCGRFTNARRAHLPEPGPWPAVRPGMNWVNIGPKKSGVDRLPDIPSREVAAARPADLDITMVHLMRDLADLILVAGQPDEECARWCKRVLCEPDYAMNLYLSEPGDEPE